MKLGRLLVAGSLIIFAGCGSTPYRVAPADPDTPGHIAYSLPAVDFVLTVQARTTRRTYGPLYCYGRLMGVSAEVPCGCGGANPGQLNVAAARTGHPDPAVTCTDRLAKLSTQVRSARVSPVPYADSSQSYDLFLDDPNVASRRSLSLTFSDEGLMLGAETSVTSQVPEILSRTVSSVGSLAGVVIRSAAGVPAAPNVTAAEERSSVTDPNVALCNRVKRSCNRNRPCESDVQARCSFALQARAELVAAARRRHQLIGLNNAPQETSESFTRALAAADAEIATLSALFLRRAQHTDREASHRFEPSSRPTCFTVSHAGVVSPQANCAGLTAQDVQVNMAAPDPSWAAESQRYVTQTCRSTPAGSCGFVYRVPQLRQVEVTTIGGRQLELTRIAIPQWGRLVVLPNRFVGSSALNITLSPTTGMLRSIAFAEQNIDMTGLERVDSTLQNLGESIRTVRAERAAAATSADDSIPRLEAQVRRLELERQIQCYAELGRPCPDDDEGDGETEE